MKIQMANKFSQFSAIVSQRYHKPIQLTLIVSHKHKSKVFGIWTVFGMEVDFIYIKYKISKKKLFVKAFLLQSKSSVNLTV